MRWVVGLSLVCALGCAGEPVGEGAGGAGGSGAGATGGSAGLGGSSGLAGSAGSSGSAGSGGSAGSAGSGPLVPGDEGGAEGLALDATHVFFGRGKGLYRVPKLGGDAELVGEGTQLVREIVVVGADVVFLDGARTLRRVAKAGGSVSLVAQGASGSEAWGDIATDGSDVFFTTTFDQSNFAGAVLRVAPGGGVPAVIHEMIGAVQPTGIAHFGTDVYWTNHVGKTVMRAPAAGGKPTWLASSLEAPWHIAVNATHVYYTDQIGGLFFFEHEYANAIVEQVLSDGAGHDVALDDTAAYWTAPSYGKVFAAALGDDLATVLLSDASVPQSIAVDEDAVYVTCAGGSPGAVVRIDK